jgi:hypothetical protein
MFGKPAFSWGISRTKVFPISLKLAARRAFKARCFDAEKYMSDQILTTAEIAAELRCSKAQVYRLLNGEVRDVPKLPCISLGRKKVVRRCSFEEWKRENEKGILTAELEMNAVGRAS